MLIRLLAWKLFHVPSVTLIDHDGGLNQRYAHKWGPIWVAHRHGYGIRTVQLADAGRVINGCYVDKWLPLVGDVK